MVLFARQIYGVNVGVLGRFVALSLQMLNSQMNALGMPVSPIFMNFRGKNTVRPLMSSFWEIVVDFFFVNLKFRHFALGQKCF